MIYQKKCVACDGSIPTRFKHYSQISKKVDGWNVKSDESKILLIEEIQF